MSAQGSQAQHPAAETNRTPLPLRGRLPALKAAQAQLARKLFDAARVFVADNAIRLSVAAPGPLPRELVECEAGGELALVGIVRDEILDPCAGGAWSDYQGFPRCAAWALAHERLLHALSGLLGQALLPKKILIASNAAPGVVWLGLRANLQRAETVGVLALPLAPAQALAAALRTRGAPAGPTPRTDAGALRETLLLTAAGPPLTSSHIADFGPGDVIVLGARAHVLADLHLSRTLSPRSARWQASWRDGRVHVRGIAASGYARSNPVNDILSTNDQHEASPATAAQSHPPHIPVALEFELGAVDSSLRELAQIEPGYVFDLPLQLDRATVTIRSGGKRVGRGELVAVGDTLGVRLTEWFADGA